MKRFQKFMFSFFVAFSLFVMTVPVVMAEDSEVIEEANYTITYVLSGGVNSTSNPETYDGKTTITLKNPTRTGYTFGGWYSDSNYKKKVTSIKEGSTGNKTLYAKWSVNSYTIKYNSNGGTGKMSNTSTKYNKNVTLTNKFKRTGYTFTGWNTKKDGTGTSYENKEVVKGLVSKNKGTITLYAQWKKNTYTIKYNLNGGNEVSNPTTYTVTTKTITLKNPKRTGYTFQGWYSDSKYKKKVTSIKKGSTGNKTLYAKWTANTYTVKYNSNGGTGKMSNTSAKYNKSVTLTSNKFKRTGYTFTGWNTKKDGTGTSYKNKASIKNLTSKNKGTVTLYAEWKKNTYTIKYNLNGGNEVSNPTTYTVTTKTITLKNPTRTGYTFGGWYSDSKYKKKVTSIKKGSTGNKTLYAKWTANSYTIKYSGNGSTSGKMSSTSAKYNKSVTLTANKFKRTGYTFTGWNTKKDGTGTTYKNKESIKNLTSKNKGTVTLYAQWEKNIYTINYNLNGGVNNEDNPESYSVDTNTITLKNPTKEGYTFGGWYSDSKYKNKVTSIKKGSTGNKTLYAKWALTKYTAKYNLNGGKISGTAVQSFYVNTETFSLPNATRTGYTFDGWYTDSDFNEKISEVTKGTAKNVEFYAKWTPITYHVSFDSNGGLGDNIDSITCTYDEICSLPSANYSHDSLTFVSWNTNKNNTGKSYEPSQEVKNLSSVADDNVVLYAQYSVASTPTPVVEATTYSTIRVTFTPVTGADGYDVYRSTSINGPYNYVGGKTTEKYYLDSNLKEKTTYYYQVIAYVLNEDNIKVYSSASEVVAATTPYKPKFTFSFSPTLGKYHSITSLIITNTGKANMEITNYFQVYPYENATDSTAYALGYGKFEKIIIAPGESVFLTLELDTSRYFSSGCRVNALFTYDGGSSYFSLYADGRGVFL